MAKILLVDDDPAILEVLGAYLNAEGHTVHEAHDGPRALEQLHSVDLVVLDWMMPGMSGIEVARVARAAHPDLPLLMLSARGEEEDRLSGLDVGADDYVVKPFSPREVVARVRALLRRSGRHDEITSGPLRLNAMQRIAELDGQEVNLSKIEFDLLLTLAQHPGLVWTRERLLERVWGPDYPGVGRVVDVHVTSLRRKLGDDPDHPTFIETVRGVGYRFRDDRSASKLRPA